jgi:hypothetical protein
MLDAVQQYMTIGDNQGSYDGEEQRQPVLI